MSSAPQTNEVRRAAILVPGFLEIARWSGLPLFLSEIGASVGLNLLWDQFGHTLGELTWGNVASPVQLTPIWRGPAVLDQTVHVGERSACDLNPLASDRTGRGVSRSSTTPSSASIFLRRCSVWRRR